MSNENLSEHGKWMITLARDNGIDTSNIISLDVIDSLTGERWLEAAVSRTKRMDEIHQQLLDKSIISWSRPNTDTQH